MAVSVGDIAPDFALPNQHGEEFKLSEYKGKPVVLVFYPLSFSGTCTGEMCELRDNLDVFKDAKVELEERGHGTRATYVINHDQIVVAKFTTSPGEARDLASYRSALELL